MGTAASIVWITLVSFPLLIPLSRNEMPVKHVMRISGTTAFVYPRE